MEPLAISSVIHTQITNEEISDEQDRPWYRRRFAGSNRRSSRRCRNCTRPFHFGKRLGAPTTTVAALHDRDRRYRGGRGRVYDDRGRYYEPRRISRRDRMWRGNDGRYYCKRDNGTTGLVIGAGVGALAGHEIAGRGDRTLGAILGGVVGGVVGREIDRGSLSCR